MKPIPNTVNFRIIYSDNIKTEIEIDAESFVELMQHFKSSGLNKITKAECELLADLYENIYRNSIRD